MLFGVTVGIAAAAVAVSASPVQSEAQAIHLPLKQVSHFKSIKNIVEKGQQRIEKMNRTPALGNKDAVGSGTITNDDVSYLAGVSIGGKTYQLIVDTGSSNLWCGAQSKCEPSSTGKSTGQRVQVSYGSGSFSGTEYTDTVSFGGVTVSKQSLGSASSSSGFSGVDGIIGFGPVALTANTVSGASTVPTFMDNLYSAGTIPTEVLGVYFQPITNGASSSANGLLTLGGTNSAKYSGSIAYFPKTTSGSGSPYWGISVGGFTYGSTSLGGATTGAIVDTGTTLIYIPTSAYNAFLSASGGKTDSASGLASFTTKPTGNFAVKFGSTSFTLTPSQYLVPTNQYSNFGLASGKYYAWINNGGSSGVNCIIGQKFLENYYSVFDTTNSRIGFATRT